MFIRANSPNMVPDSEVSGTVILDLRDVPLAAAIYSEQTRRLQAAIDRFEASAVNAESMGGRGFTAA